ncbi:hypothetical protein [Chromobacterium violaceum]|uniref:hypothetical protein n=1 Tax=Chromobacterium violaceum TaxID=536 RepID=UPI00143D428F|nr:hypothetical protein [Chromobacterium violaceum]QIY81268.1 hypothetical protein FOB43_19745 [Chromobacterium violaceum]
MAYTLQAIITRSGTLSEPLPSPLKLVHLSRGIDLIPIGRDAIKAHALPFQPLTDEGQKGLPRELTELCKRLSAQGLLAYVEAEFFGGAGTQAYALFSSGNGIGHVVVSDSAINEALRHLGVSKGETFDEFVAVGLEQYRNTDDWLA